jgi:hypothetical protein
MFFTTNRVIDFDEAMQSRIHLTLKYSALGVNTRKGIWTSFLKTAKTIKGEAIYTVEELNELARKCLNGQEVSFVSYESSVSEIYTDIANQKYSTSSARTSGP